MKEKKIISRFSKFSKSEKLDYLAQFFDNPNEFREELDSYTFSDPVKQKIFDEFSENTISNFMLPYGVVPNVVINDEQYAVPVVIEECSVVAAASKSAKFWAERGGFKAEVLSITKIGQVHFIWNGDKKKLFATLPELKVKLRNRAKHVTENMEKRNGGIKDIELIDMTDQIDNYYQIKASFDTRDSMGANFINSCLEDFSAELIDHFDNEDIFESDERDCQIIMAILSNYTPECLVNCYVECDIEDLGAEIEGVNIDEFVWKFDKAVRIAEIDVHRATTHNKGIFNGIDAVAIATGNDFRAIEACGHTYASKDGRYKSLTHLSLENGKFKYSLTVAMAMGTVGGITALHPLAKRSIELLGNPNATELMMITAAIGLANNFAAVKALVTKGIQKGHMKMHLSNILNVFDATPEEKKLAEDYFKNHKVSFKNGRIFIDKLRLKNGVKTADKI